MPIQNPGESTLDLDATQPLDMQRVLAQLDDFAQLGDVGDADDGTLDSLNKAIVRAARGQVEIA